MATADQIERIVLELEESGAAGAYVAVKRVDGVFAELEKKKGPADVLEAFAALETSLSKTLVELPNMSDLTDQATAAWVRLVAQLRKYEEAQARKHERNQILIAAKLEAEAQENAYQKALRAQEEHSRAMRRADQVAADLEKKQQANVLMRQDQNDNNAYQEALRAQEEHSREMQRRDRNAQRAQAQDDEKEYQKALKREEAHRAAMRAGESPLGGGGNKGPAKLSTQARFGQMLFKTFGPKNAQAIGNVAEMFEKIGPVVSKLGPPLATAAAGVAAFSVAAAGAGIYAAKEFGMAVIDAQAYREDIFEAFKIQRRTQGDAQAVMQQAMVTADQLGIDRAKGAGQFLDLLTKFQDTKVVDSLVRSLADLETIDPQANMDGLTKALGKMQGQGKLTGEVLASLNDNGLEQGEVIAQLGKRYGKTRDEINKMISAGKVDEVAGREAIQAAIAQQVGGGPAGAAATEKADRNLSSLIKRVKDIPSNILFDVSVGPGIDGVKEQLRTVIDYFDPVKGNGKEVRAVAGDLFNGLVEGLTGNKIDTKKGITGTLDAIVAGAREAVPIVRDIADGMRTFAGIAASVGAGMRQLSEFTEPIGQMAGAWKALTLGARLLTAPFGGFILLLPEIIGGIKMISKFATGDWKGAMKELGSTPFDGLFSNIGATIKNSLSLAWEALKQAGSDALSSAMQIGSNIVAGIVGGISGGIQTVMDAGSALAKAALGGTTDTLKVRSPSQEYDYLGEMSAVGLENRLWRGVDAVWTAGAALGGAALGGTASAMDAAPVPRLLPAKSGGTATGGGAPIYVTLAPTIQVVGAKSEAEARAMGIAAAEGAQPVFEENLATALRLLAAQ